MLQGYSVPLSPLGKAALIPPPPWHYAGDVLAIEFWASPNAIAALLPPGLSADPDSPNRAMALFTDWQFTAQDDEHLDPARYQYREASVLVDARHDGIPVRWSPYSYVDNDAALARGWVHGFPQKHGNIHQTRSFAAPGRAAAPIAAGSRFGASLSAHGERLMTARITLRDALHDPNKLLARPMVLQRHFPCLTAAQQTKPAVHELALVLLDDPRIADAWMGEAELSLPAAGGEELHALTPIQVGTGFRYSLSYSVSDLRVLQDLAHSMSSA